MGDSSHSIEPKELLAFIEMEGFAQDWKDLGLSDDDLLALQIRIMSRPTGFPVVPGTGGLRKIRFAPARSKKGKSGAIRVCYVYFPQFGFVLLVIAYSKKELDDISPGQKKTIRQMIQRQSSELARKAIRQRDVLE